MRGGIVTLDLMPVLWVCGPPGVGKTMVGWQLFTELRQAGQRIGYADIDQLGMCYPAPSDDPGRHRMKARNLAAVITTFGAAGARCVVVSGVTDPAAGIPQDLLGDVALTVCRLQAGPAEIRQRLAGRPGRSGDPDAAVAGALAEAAALDASGFADVCVDTSGMPAEQVVALVRDRCEGWASRDRPGGRSRSVTGASGERHPGTAGGRALLLCGPTGVGKSAIGFEVYLNEIRAGRTAAYADLAQIGFCHPAPASDPGNHQVKARNLAALWQTYRAAGAECIVVTGPIQDEAAVQAYTRELAGTALTVARLQAGPAELTRRIMTRAGGGSWPQPGDPLAGRSAGYLRTVAGQAAADAAALEQSSIGGVRIDTDGLMVAAAAELVVTATGWR